MEESHLQCKTMQLNCIVIEFKTVNKVIKCIFVEDI